MNENDLRKRIFNIISEVFFLTEGNEEAPDDKSSLLDLTGQFESPLDLIYEPTDKDIKDIEDTWGTFEDNPMSDEERKDIADNLLRAKLRLKNDDVELAQRQMSLDKQKKHNPGGAGGRRMDDAGFNIN